MPVLSYELAWAKQFCSLTTPVSPLCLGLDALGRHGGSLRHLPYYHCMSERGRIVTDPKSPDSHETASAPLSSRATGNWESTFEITSASIWGIMITTFKSMFPPTSGRWSAQQDQCYRRTDGRSHGVFADFKNKFPEIYERNEALGRYIHDQGGPLDDKTRWLIKLAVSAASEHQTALDTHIHRAREAGASEEEILHALFLVIPPCGFRRSWKPTVYQAK